MASRLGKIFLEQNLKLKTLGYLLFIPAIFFICCLAAQWPTFDCYRGNSLTHPMLITAFGLFLAQRWLRGVGSLHLIECPIGFDHNAITHLVTHPKLQKILSPNLHPVFTKCGNAHSLTIVWTLPLFIGKLGFLKKL